MIFIILYFLLVFTVSYPIGVVLKTYFFKTPFALAETTFLGLFAILMLSSVWMFFFPLGRVWSICLLAIALGCFFICKNEILTAIHAFFKDFLNLKPLEKLGFGIVFVGVVFASSLPAYVLDNDSYYIQTIKWLDNFGLVNGLSNLHVFLYQQSGFHILEAALNFNTLYAQWNDLSGFYFLLGLLWSFQTTKNEPYNLWFFKRGFALISLIAFTFISAPSPDIPVFILSYLFVYYFLKLWDNWNEQQLLFLAFLALQIIFFKVSTFMLFAAVIVLIAKQYRQFYSYQKIIGIGLLFFLLFTLKNVVVSGLPLYPLTTWSPFEFDWKLPEQLAQFYKQGTQAMAYGISPNTTQRFSQVELFQFWFFHSGIEGVLNKLVLTCLGWAIIFLFLKKQKKSLKVLILLLIAQSVLLFMTSPQLRFFLNLMIPVMVLLFIETIKPSKMVWKYSTTGCIVVGFMLASVTQVNHFLTDNPLMRSDKNFTLKNLIFPFPKSNYANLYERIDEHNLYYHTAKDKTFMYGTYNLPLPSVSKAYIHFVENTYNLQIQMRGDDIAKGFKATPKTKH